MAEKKKSIIEEALLEAKSLEDALKANTKEMLAAHMSKEFESIVESSLKEEDEEVKEEEAEEVSEQMDDDAIEGSDDEKEEVVDLDVDEDDDSDEDEVEDMEMDDMELDLDVVDSDEDEVDGADLDLDTDLDLDAGEGEEEGEDVEMDLELPMDMDMGGEQGVIDLTMSSDDEVVKVFKKLSDDDEVEVVKDEDGIHLTDNETGAEYYIKESMDELEEMMNEKEYCAEGDCGGMGETIYEVEIDEESDIAEIMKEMEGLDEYGHMKEGKLPSMAEMKKCVSEGMSEEAVCEKYSKCDEEKIMEMYEQCKMEEGAYIDEGDEEPLEEDKLQRHRKFAGKQRYSGAKVGRRDESKRTRKPLINRKPKSSTVSETKIMKEYKELKSKNEEYKKALNVFKDKLNEVALFNTNLAYVNRLFTEHSTTKKEKMDILKRFDNAESIKESKNIYKTIKTELDNKQPINESIEKKVNKTIESSKATNLNESTAYVDPQITAIKDLMRRIS
jgi:hypothetical protein